MFRPVLVSLCEYLHEFRCSWRPEEGIRPPGAGGTGVSGPVSSPRSHLSSHTYFLAVVTQTDVSFAFFLCQRHLARFAVE